MRYQDEKVRIYPKNLRYIINVLSVKIRLMLFGNGFKQHDQIFIGCFRITNTTGRLSHYMTCMIDCTDRDLGSVTRHMVHVILPTSNVIPDREPSSPSSGTHLPSSELCEYM
jgi:hypothetical protein